MTSFQISTPSPGGINDSGPSVYKSLTSKRLDPSGSPFYLDNIVNSSNIKFLSNLPTENKISSNSALTLKLNQVYLLNYNATALTLTLPTPSKTGDFVTISYSLDTTDPSGSNPFTVSTGSAVTINLLKSYVECRNSSTIAGQKTIGVYSQTGNSSSVNVDVTGFYSGSTLTFFWSSETNNWHVEGKINGFFTTSLTINGNIGNI